MSFNRVILLGNVTREPEVKFTPKVIAKAKAMLRQKGMTVKKVAKRMRLSPSAFYHHGISKRKVANKR